jgi:hypothetical protein
VSGNVCAVFCQETTDFVITGLVITDFVITGLVIFSGDDPALW